MIDVFALPVPDTHYWVIFACWIAAYVAGRFIVGGRL